MFDMRKKELSSGKLRLYTNICFTINGPLKLLLCHFRCFYYSNVNMTFVKNSISKMDFQSSSNLLVSQNICSLATLGSKMTALLISFEVSTEAIFLCLVFVNWRDRIWFHILDSSNLHDMLYWLQKNFKLSLYKTATYIKQTIKSAIRHFFISDFI